MAPPVEQRLTARPRRRLTPPCYPARMDPPESSERLTWAVCCAVGAIVGLSAVPLVLLLPAAYSRPLIRPAWTFVVVELLVIVGSRLWDHRGRFLRRHGGRRRDGGGR